MIRNLQKEIELNNVQVEAQNSHLCFKGPKGSIVLPMESSFLKVTINDNTLSLSAPLDTLSSKERATIGTMRALIKNCISGVVEKHSKMVIFTGTGLSVKIIDDVLVMKIGKSHLVTEKIPTIVACSIKSSDVRSVNLLIESVDKCAVGHFARFLCDLSKNKYKGGIHIYIHGHEPKLKEGKK